MSIIHDQAIVLHSIKHSDSSLILHMMARGHGRVSIIAKGARSKKPRFGAALELMSHSDIIYSHRQTREIQMLREARVIDSFLPMRDDLEKTTLGLAVCELMRMVTPAEEISTELFDVALQALQSINGGKKNIRNHFWRFELELFRPLGIGLDLTQCHNCGKQLSTLETKELEFHTDHGAVRCTECKTGTGIMISMETYRVLEFLNRAKIQSVETLKVSPKAENEIKHLLSRHLRTHLPIRRDLKSLDALTWSRSGSPRS